MNKDITVTIFIALVWSAIAIMVVFFWHPDRDIIMGKIGEIKQHTEILAQIVTTQQYQLDVLTESMMK